MISETINSPVFKIFFLPFALYIAGICLSGSRYNEKIIDSGRLDEDEEIRELVRILIMRLAALLIVLLVMAELFLTLAAELPD